MQPTSHHPFRLSSFELWCVALSSAALLLLGNAKLLLEHYGLLNSSHVVGQQLSVRVTDGLSVLDSFTVTPGLVTFIVWGGVGLVTFSVTQAFFRASASLKYRRELGSNRFVHPADFDRQAYWRQTLKSAAISFGLLAVLVVLTVLYLLFIVPVSFYYIQTLLLGASLAHGLNLGVGLFVIFTGSLVLYVTFKLVRHYHSRTSR